MAQKTLGAWIRHALGGHSKDVVRPRIGMEVRTNDGGLLGTITALWLGAAALDDAAHEDTLGVLRQDETEAGLLYIPSHAIARTATDGIVLSVDGEQVIARQWRFRPEWLAPDSPHQLATWNKV